MLKKHACGYVDAARLHAGRVVYCINEEVAYEYGIRERRRRALTALTRPQSNARAFASESNLRPR